MKIWRIAVILAACGVFTGCAADLTCDDPKRYQKALPGTRIDAPEDLDELQASKELSVPSASPREPRPKGSPCLDLPPVLKLK